MESRLVQQSQNDIPTRLHAQTQSWLGIGSIARTPDIGLWISSLVNGHFSYLKWRYGTIHIFGACPLTWPLRRLYRWTSKLGSWDEAFLQVTKGLSMYWLTCWRHNCSRLLRELSFTYFYCVCITNLLVWIYMTNLLRWFTVWKLVVSSNCKPITRQ